MLNVCVQRFNVTENLLFLCKFSGSKLGLNAAAGADAAGNRRRDRALAGCGCQSLWRGPGRRSQSRARAAGPLEVTVWGAERRAQAGVAGYRLFVSLY
jgi:hypothetical protein